MTVSIEVCPNSTGFDVCMISDTVGWSGHFNNRCIRTRPARIDMCPHCHEAMVTLELDGIEVDRCFACNGTWLDEGELEWIGRFEGPGH